MKRITIAVLATLTISAGAKEYPLTVLKGGAEIVKGETGEQVIISSAGKLFPKDMLSLDNDQQASIAIEKNTVALLKGPASLTFLEIGNTLTVSLDEGQLLLNRKQPYELSGITIVSKGVSFVPMGTCVAVKTTSPAQPTAAVIEGKVRMQSPSGEAVVVDKGNYGNIGSDGKLATGALSPHAVESLNEWLAQAPVLSAAESEAMPAPPMVTAALLPAPRPVAPIAATVHPVASQPTALPAAITTLPAPRPSVPVVAAIVSTPSADLPATQKPSPANPLAQQANVASEETLTPQASDNTTSEELPKEQQSARKVDKTPAPPSSPKWEISAGTATVDNEQWTRLALGVDVPLWKFGVFFDVELFIDNNGQVSDKGWNFDDDWLDALSRKIRYIRFGQEGEPLFIKVGGLSSVTMGYGFIVDRFTNMLHYPDQKQLGLQFDLNDISPIGVTLQTLVADFKEFDYDGGVVAARLAVRPLKMSGIPIIKGIAIGGMYATDLNQYAPARKWDFTMTGTDYDRDVDGIQDSGNIRSTIETGGYTFTNEARRRYIEAGQYDTIIEHRDQWASREEDPFGLIGGDIGIPLIATSLVGLDLYGQAAIRDDGKHGWGIGAPGLALKLWRLWANVEYRRIQGRFQPGYFGTYYLDERIMREPEISTKEKRLVSDTLNGVFGRLGFNIADVLVIDGSYQYMIGNKDTSKDQRFEVSGALGDIILQKIPKLNRAEVYYNKARIGVEEDNFFEKTPYMYYGYRAGFEISEGASLIWDYRYGYEYNKNGKLEPNNNFSIQTAITF
jgi:hypothetical protein